jgi:DNA-binding NtrC family response regulator
MRRAPRARVPAHVLIIEDDPSVRRALEHVLRGLGCEPDLAADSATATRHLEARKYDLVLCDVRLPDGDGFAVLTAVRRTPAPPPVVMLTAFATVSGAVEAMKRGAFSFVAKPFRVEEVEDVVREALATRAARGEGEGDVVLEDPASKELLDLVERVAPGDATVLITGESGAGKEIVARALHRSSGRHGAFVPINCAAIPDALLESELFGHVRGAFTGATASQPGRFLLADRGTMFLDEIGDMSAHLQAKLLRAIQDREVWPVGGSAPHRTDARIIAATNANLDERVHQGRFRSDLYWRLAVIPIHVRPLRERPADIPALARHFLRAAALRRGQPVLELSEAALSRLRGYRWPGNVRELANLCERLAALKNDGHIEDADLPEALREAPKQSADGLALREALERLEERMIDDAMRKTTGNKGRAARLLGLKRTTLIEKLKRRRQSGSITR